MGSAPETVSDARRRADERGLRWIHLLVALAVVGSIAAVCYAELRTAWLQAHVLADWADEIEVRTAAGPSATIRFPEAGPYDRRLGYARLPEMLSRLDERGFRIVAQARTSDRFRRAMDLGLFPIYRVKTRAGLTVLDPRDRPIHDASFPALTYSDYADIPPLVVETLLHLENRELLAPGTPFRNPAVEWDRFAGAVLGLGLERLSGGGATYGGSTLATQMEKFRHSPGGLTDSPPEKLRQMGSAAVRAYLDGPRTLETRRRIVRDYLNSVPLAAVPGYGEVIGLGDGLQLWAGVDFEVANRELWRLSRAEDAEDAEGAEGAEDAEDAEGAEDAEDAEDAEGAEETEGAEDAEAAGGVGPAAPANGKVGTPVVTPEAAKAYLAVVGLLFAQRRPSYYLASAAGRDELVRLARRHLDLLEAHGRIPSALAAAAREATLEVRPRTPPPIRVPFVERKASSAIRTHLLGVLGVSSLYELDRLDVAVRSTLDAGVEEAIGERLQRLADPAYVRSVGLDGFRLLGGADPAKVVYSVLLYERTPVGNVVRLQTDNYDGPFDLNQASRLELGSTAKLRTLVTYLEIVEELHLELRGLSADELRALGRDGPSDPITRWAIEHLLRSPESTLDRMLSAAMDRRYSASPAERFFTGGGTHVFRNFDATHDGAVLTVREGFRHSVNLVFVRLMRDIVRYAMLRIPGSSARILEDPEDPRRQEYLERFADREGREFVERFYRKLSRRTPDELLEALVGGRRLSPERLAWTFRSVAPGADLEAFAAFLRDRSPNTTFSGPALQDLYDRSETSRFDLADRGYLARVHPLELWVAAYLLQHPEASLAEVFEASTGARQEVYGWLFQNRRRAAQDQRIRILLEVEAFMLIQRQWRKLGYPFDNLVPSYGSSIGSSGDRPGALAELVGILLGDGMRRPIVRVDRVRFAAGTPFETVLEREPGRGTRVLSREVAATARAALLDVVEAGTARAAGGLFRDSADARLPLGGKTGTGNNQYKVFGPGGRLLEARTVNRTASFVFYIGDRWFGVITAHVPGADAEAFRFTSALPVRLLGLLSEDLRPLVSGDPGDPASGGPDVAP